ncbi:hypothetical protein CGZ80_00065 [Rhodopirellula sp. MGV]|nr:hypothetical protein CGZ80_00065 [Rhodopirellula sp. MGV]
MRSVASESKTTVDGAVRLGTVNRVAPFDLNESVNPGVSPDRDKGGNNHRGFVHGRFQFVDMTGVRLTLESMLN